MILAALLFSVLPYHQVVQSVAVFLDVKNENQTEYHLKYSNFPESLRLQMLAKTKQMFYFGYESYMKFAFPLDELNPIDCKGRGPDYANP